MTRILVKDHCSPPRIMSGSRTYEHILFIAQAAARFTHAAP